MPNTNSPLNLAKWRIGIGKSIEINHDAWFTPKIDNTQLEEMGVKLIELGPTKLWLKSLGYMTISFEAEVPIKFT